LNGVSGGVRVIGSGSEVNGCLFGRLLGEALPSIDFAHGDLSGTNQGPEQRRCLGRGQHGLRLDAALELIVQPLDRFGRTRRLPMARGQPRDDRNTMINALRTMRWTALALIVVLLAAVVVLVFRPGAEPADESTSAGTVSVPAGGAIGGLFHLIDNKGHSVTMPIIVAAGC
jgi:hypothetical protein